MALLALCGCRTIKFYAQAIKGQCQILAREEPIDRLLAKPDVPEKLRKQLVLLQQLRVFAATNLSLPVDGHYRKYADLERPFVVWNIQAAPELSLEAKTWWYPLVGSLDYRGYFSAKAAQDYAAWLRQKSYDVNIGGVEAYSTLGWFKDPVLNTFIFNPEPDLAELIFHELGHQQIFARGDTDFNEAFATTVGQEGARRWLQQKGDRKLLDQYILERRRNDQFVHLVMQAREKLEAVYGDKRDEDGKLRAAKRPPASLEQLRQEKHRLLVQLRSDYESLKAQWGGYNAYDYFFDRDLNNAQLNSVANYYDLVPGFEHLLHLNNDDLPKFYAAAQRLANKSKDDRHQWLRTLATAGGRDPLTNTNVLPAATHVEAPSRAGE